ncbi:MAG TPA: hypothetical protein VMB21_03090 [Candidatus Limnocylindria bacterium]|jgi:hypothetical protein|nr:hypothetical protein [Candidatus Limnocylindria bacterium]
MTDDPDNRAKLLVFAVVVGWLLVAVAVFATDGETLRHLVRLAAMVGLPGLVIGLPLVMAWSARARIREAIAESGGDVESLRALPLSQQDWWHPWRGGHRNSTKFVVEYTDLLGRRHRAICRSNFTYGVVWLADALVTDSPAGK